MRDSDLDDLFATARAGRPVASAALMTRVLADAAVEQPRATVRPVPAPGFWRSLLAALGGGGALAALSTAMLAGVWLGFAQPGAMDRVTEALLPPDTIIEVETVDVIAGFDEFLTEG